VLAVEQCGVALQVERPALVDVDAISDAFPAVAVPVEVAVLQFDPSFWSAIRPGSGPLLRWTYPGRFRSASTGSCSMRSPRGGVARRPKLAPRLGGPVMPSLRTSALDARYSTFLRSSVKRYSTAFAFGKVSAVRIATTGCEPTTSVHVLCSPSSSVILRTIICSSMELAWHRQTRGEIAEVFGSSTNPKLRSV
jgi:hypothetical protein